MLDIFRAKVFHPGIHEQRLGLSFGDGGDYNKAQLVDDSGPLEGTIENTAALKEQFVNAEIGFQLGQGLYNRLWHDNMWIIAVNHRTRHRNNQRKIDQVIKECIMSEDRKDKGWEFLQNDGEEGPFYEDDGSWGTKNADGSASFYGADGSWGTRHADGSISYYGNDGTWGYKNSDGSGAYYSGSGSDNSYYDADEVDNDSGDSNESSSGDLTDALAGLFAVALGAGIAAHSRKKQQEREEEARRQAEAERVRIEKKKERKAININKTVHNRYTDDAEVERVKVDDKKDKRSWIFLAVLWGALALIIIGVNLYFTLAPKVAESQGKISAGYYRDLIGEDYEMVEAHFEAAGFTNIELIDLDDAGLAFWNEGKVKTISVGGDTSFESTDYFDPDTKVVISYH